LGLITLALGLTIGATLADEPKPHTLLWQTAVPQPGQPPLPNKKPWVIREREIVFDPQALVMLKDAAARPHPSIAVELFDGHSYDLDIVSTVSRLSDIATVKGTLKHAPQAPWSLIINGSLVNGSFQIGRRLYRIEHVQNGRHRLLEVDPAKLPPD
jgi:hypothetical protein